MLLKDKVVIISGVGPGMGQSMAKLAAREGAKVGMGARNQEYLDSVAAEIKDNGGEVVAISTDISHESQCQNLVNKVVEAFGRVDGLVNSAYLHGEWATTDVADTSSWSDLYEVNCLGVNRTPAHDDRAVLHMPESDIDTSCTAAASTRCGAK